MSFDDCRRSVPLSCLAVACAALVSLPREARAQAMELKPARIEYEFFPTTSVRSPASERDSEARFQAARASLSVPMPAGKSGALLIPGLKYQVLDVGQSERAASDSDSVESLHSL